MKYKGAGCVIKRTRTRKWGQRKCRIIKKMIPPGGEFCKCNLSGDVQTQTIGWPVSKIAWFVGSSQISYIVN